MNKSHKRIWMFMSWGWSFYWLIIYIRYSYSFDYGLFFADVISGETAIVKKNTILEKNRSNRLDIKDQIDQ